MATMNWDRVLLARYSRLPSPPPHHAASRLARAWRVSTALVSTLPPPHPPFLKTCESPLPDPPPHHKFCFAPPPTAPCRPFTSLRLRHHRRRLATRPYPSPAAGPSPPMVIPLSLAPISLPTPTRDPKP